MEEEEDNCHSCHIEEEEEPYPLENDDKSTITLMIIWAPKQSLFTGISINNSVKLIHIPNLVGGRLNLIKAIEVLCQCRDETVSYVPV